MPWHHQKTKTVETAKNGCILLPRQCKDNGALIQTKQLFTHDEEKQQQKHAFSPTPKNVVKIGIFVENILGN